MTTFLEAALYQRMVHISADPHETARQITAEQFRPTEKKDHGIIERDTTEHTND